MVVLFRLEGCSKRVKKKQKEKKDSEKTQGMEMLRLKLPTATWICRDLPACYCN